MAEFQKVINELYRMCKTKQCHVCPMSKASGTSTCYVWMKSNPSKAENVIMQWAAAHPIKTNRDKFRDVFGKDLVVIGHTKEWLDQEDRMEQWKAAGNMDNIHWYGVNVTLKEDSEENVREAEELLKEQLARALKLKMTTIKTPMPNEGCKVSVKVGVLFPGGQDGTD